MPPASSHSSHSQRHRGGRGRRISRDNASAATSGSRTALPRRDLHHNRDVPCCRLLQELAEELCAFQKTPSVETPTTAPPTTLTRLLGYLLLQQSPPSGATTTPAALQTSTGATETTRKKRRKQRRKRMSEEETLVDAGTEPEPAATTSPRTTLSQQVVGDAIQASGLEEPRPPLPSRSRRIRLEQVDELLNLWLAIRAQQPDDSFESLVRHLPLLTAQLRDSLRVSELELQQAIQDIHCQTCRQKIANFVAKQDQVTLVLNPLASSPVSFDYVAMEEGVLPTHSGNKPVDDELALSFHRVVPSNGEAYWELLVPMDQPSDPQEDPATRRDQQLLQIIRDLAYDYILACGIAHDQRVEMMGYRVMRLSPQVLTSLQERVRTNVRQWDSIRNEITSRLELLSHTWQETLAVDVTPIETITYPKLTQVDQGLDALAQEVRLHLIQPVVTAYCETTKMFANQTASEQRQEMELQMGVQDLWTVFMDYIHSCIENVAGYESNLFELASRHGVIPAAYLSPTIRELFRSLVRKKIIAVHGLIEQVDKISEREVELGLLETSNLTKTSLRRKLLVRKAYCDALHQAGPDRSTLMMEKSQQAWESYMQELCRCSETVHQPSIEKVLQQHEHQREKLRASLLHAVQTLEDVCRGQEEGVTSNGDDLSDSELPPRVAVLHFTESMSRSHPLEAFRSNFRSGAACSACLWTEWWRPCQPLPHHDGTSLPLKVPFQILKTMLHDEEDALARCYGGLEENRVACMLVGSFFRHLSTLSDEWRAHVVGLELISSDVSEEKCTAEAEKTKKKSKKKKKPKASADDPPGHDHQPVKDSSLELEDEEESSSKSEAQVPTQDGRDGTEVMAAKGDNNALLKDSSGKPRDLPDGRRSPNQAESAPRAGTPKDLGEVGTRPVEPPSQIEMGSSLVQAKPSQVLTQPDDLANQNDELQSGDSRTMQSSIEQKTESSLKVSKGTLKGRDTTRSEKRSSQSSPTPKSSQERVWIEKVDSNVGVYDGQGHFEPAQDFLLNRLILAFNEQ